MSVSSMSSEEEKEHNGEAVYDSKTTANKFNLRKNTAKPQTFASSSGKQP